MFARPLRNCLAAPLRKVMLLNASVSRDGQAARQHAKRFVTHIVSGWPNEILKAKGIDPQAIQQVRKAYAENHPAIPGTTREVKEDLPVAARALRLTIQPWEIRAADELDRVFNAQSKGRPDGLYVSPGALVNTHRKRIIGLASKSRLPAIYARIEYVDEGGLMSYDADVADGYRRVAYYVDKILKGAKPADLPVEQPMKFELVINLLTAKQIGLTIPPNVLARADKVIK
jgi:putative ABC transport system substrate-binding protein